METSRLPLVFPRRPQVSKTFQKRPIKLTSNHFTISVSPQQASIYLYSVEILDVEKDEQIPADARTQRQKIMRAAIQKLKELFGETLWYSGQLLWSVKLFQEPKPIETQYDNKNYVIRLKKTREINLKPDTFQDNVVAAPARQYLNILIKRYFKELGYQEWGMNAKFYNPNDTKKIPDFFLEVYTGFKTSCEVYQHSTPKVLIDFSSRILRSDSALYYIKEAKSSQEVREMLQGRSVVASYGNFRMWRVDDIDFTSNPTKKFDFEGRNMTLIDYYKTKYNIKITDPTQPLLVSIDKRKNQTFLLIPELVQMTGLDEEMRKDFNLMSEVAKITRLEPNRRMQQIKERANSLSGFFSNQYGITMDQQSFIEGHLLNPPKLTLGNGSFVPERGNYPLKDPVFKPADFKNWLFVYPTTSKEDANYFVETLLKCAGTFAIKVGKPTKVEIKEKSPEALKEAIRKNFIPSTPDKAGTQIVVAMYPPVAKKPWYKALKDVCYREKGIPSQAVVSTSLKKNAMSVCSKLLLQMNAKIGCELWITEVPKGLPERTMIIGADVFHKTKIGEELKSCIGFCASLDPKFSKFFSKVSFQKRLGEEIMTNIGRLVKEAVLKYFAYNKKQFLPEYIIFFRDGVAENQLGSIMELETKTIIEQLKTINKDYNFKFAEIVVTKRIDDRIFATEGSSQKDRRGGSAPQGISNPPAGTLVADTIVSNNFDYILVSQNVNQGTCTPTRYNVIYDTTGLPQEVFWELTYTQCYNYYNWNGGVRVPAPVQYAHKLAYLVGQTVQGDPDIKLDQTLYYL